LINRNSSHTGRMLILLGDVRRDTTVAISVVVILKQQSKVWSFDQQKFDSHAGRILILLGDIRRDKVWPFQNIS